MDDKTRRESSLLFNWMVKKRRGSGGGGSNLMKIVAMSRTLFGGSLWVVGSGGRGGNW